MTAIAAAEKKKKKDEMYYKFNTSRGMGHLKSRMRNYDNAAILYTTAVENAEPGFEKPLIIARSKAYSKMVDHEAARTDALTIVEKDPEDIQGLENDAYTLYNKDDFEDALVRHHCGLRVRKKPDYFYKGILVGKETIEDCIGRNAGPCLDQDRLGQTIVDMHMKRRHHVSDEDPLSEAKRRYQKERIDRFLAQKYLGRLADDKQFLQDYLKLPDLKSGNKEHNKQLEALLKHMLDVINRQQETLMTQRPMYMLKHHEPKFSERYQAQKMKEDEGWRNGVMKVIKSLLLNAKELQRERKIEACLNVCERLRRFIECQPPALLSAKSREQALDKLYNVIGQLYMETKMFLPNWSEVDNERRIEVILCSRVDDQRFHDKVSDTYFPKIWNVKEMKKSLESRLSVSIHLGERMFLYHEVARCLLKENATEKVYKIAAQGYRLAKEERNSLWAFNCGFLTSLAVLLEGNSEDAKIGFTEAIINARRIERDDCASFIQKVMKILAEPNRLNYDSPDPREKREREIIRLMPTTELRIKAQTILQKIRSAPNSQKLQLAPSVTIKPVSAGNSRRSMRVATRQKRHTLYQVKSSSRNQTQLWDTPKGMPPPPIDDY